MRLLLAPSLIIVGIMGLTGIMGIASPGAALAQASREGEIAELRQRVEQLEEQIVNLQVVIGTLETLARGRVEGSLGTPSLSSAGGASGDGELPAVGSSGDLAARLAVVETQIQALAGQLARIRSGQGGGTGSGVGTGAGTGAGAPASASTGDASGGLAAPLDLARPRATDRPMGATESPSDAAGFGSVTVNQATGNVENLESDPIGRMIAGGNDESTAGAIGRNERSQPPIRIARREAEGPERLYDEAYGHLLDQNYAAAETAFAAFLRRYPGHARAGDAMFWLGESRYVRGQYRRAADAFLKAYKSYPRSSKAPDSLLKLAMSLSRLNQKEAACATLAEVRARYTKGPDYLIRRAIKEERRTGC